MATQQQIADHLDLTDRWVRKLTRDGVLPCSTGKGGYDIEACRIAYIRYLRGVSNGQVKKPEPTDDDAESKDYQQRLEYEKWREKKRENDLAESLVAPVSVLTEALEKFSDRAVPVLESLPLEMKRLNPKLTGHDIQTVKKAIAKCRNAIADISIESEDED